MAERVFITGVSSGLGRGLAEAYLDRGADVSGCSRRVPEDLVARGLRHRSVDLSLGEAPEAAGPLRELVGRAEAWEAVFLNAGRLGEIRDMADTPLADLRETMEVNVWANKWILDLFFSKGVPVRQVVAISSGASQSGSRGWNGYSVSKAALNMLIKLYAAERPETCFTALAPGLVESSMQDYLTSLPADDRFEPLEILKAARGTDRMPDGRTCAERIIEALPRLAEQESGAYADLRNL
ncbi:MAG: SDR family NAD(P)-dependent oxidoreductase [Puniceicoccaceae bacterium]